MSDILKLIRSIEANSRDEESREEYIRAPFSCAGSKYKLLDKILPLLPYRQSYISVCGGSGVDLFNRSRSELEVFNDRYAGIVAFYRCLRDPIKYPQLVDRLKLVVYSREEFIWCKETWNTCTEDVERAARWYYLARCSFGAARRNFGRITSGRSQQTIKYSRSLSLFQPIHERLRNVTIENMDAVQCIKDYDTAGAVFYIDPDYIGTTPGLYEHTVDHDRLLKSVFDGKGFFAVSGYPNKLYDDLKWTARHEWQVYSPYKPQAFTSTNSLKSRKDTMTRDFVTEVLWIKDHND